MYFCCRSCTINYPEDKYKDLMDEYLEEKLANVPVNRL
ncbi:dual CXXC motif small (seleno)protein [Desulfobacula sp.]